MVLMACYAPATMLKDTNLVDTAIADMDNDGFDVDEDCDDGDPAINPDATEICDDTVDNDCDDLVDADDVDDCPAD
jgi:hypothetical protein